MKKYFSLMIIIVLSLPLALHAAEFAGLKGLITSVGGLINPLIKILVGVALLLFFWGLARFIFRVGGDEKAVDEGKRIMLWGLIALFVMLSVWGITSLISRELGITSTTPTSVPTTAPTHLDVDEDFYKDTVPTQPNLPDGYYQI